MTAQAATTFGLTALLVMCRFGGAFVLLPGFAAARVPVTIRVLILLSLSVAVTPFLMGQINLVQDTDVVRARMVETVVGLTIGFWCYLFLHAARFAGAFFAASIGLAGIPGQPIDDSQPESPLATLMSLAVTAALFATDVHLLSLQAILHSYTTLPFATLPQAQWLLERSVSLLGDTFLMALQVSGPLAVFSIVANFALGLVNKFTPQLSVFFAATGITTVCGVVLLALLAPGVLRVPVAAYQSWLEEASQ